MKTMSLFSLGIIVSLPLALGCEPRPVVNQPATVEEPAVDSDAGRVPPATESTTTDENANVDVQVGGGQGVQVDISEDATQP